MSFPSSATFSLESFLQPPHGDHDDWVRYGAGPRPYDAANSTTNFSDYWRDICRRPTNNPEVAEFFQRLRAAPVIELGGDFGNSRFLTRKAQASVYVNVDLYPSIDNLATTPIDATKPASNVSFTTTEERAEILVRGDMLDFLRRVPDRSVNIIVNGIDDCVIGKSGYHKALAEEISRVVVEGGIVCGIHSACLSYVDQTLFSGDMHPVHRDDPFPFGAFILVRNDASGTKSALAL